MRKIKKFFVLGLICTMTVSFSGCKKRYVSPMEEPNMTRAPEDKEYEFDFVQINNDVIESLQDQEIYSFVKSVDVTGDNDNKEINLNIDIEENVSDDAIELLLTDATKAIIDAANTQDLRIDRYTEDEFGNLFNLYSYNVKVTSGEEVVREENLNKGDSVPFDPSMTIENVIG
ncbi:MAG: hypothetical protein E7232_10115 [Lachnospiraceae bacterium]|nr:hypothetical protein [Lachnospiraceae bacterium]